MSVNSDCQCAKKISCNEVRHSFHASGKTQLFSLLVIRFAHRRTDRTDWTTTERTNKLTNERTNERASERASERANERTKERTNKQTSERANERLQRTSQPTNEQTKKRRSEYDYFFLRSSPFLHALDNMLLGFFALQNRKRMQEHDFWFRFVGILRTLRLCMLIAFYSFRSKSSAAMR